MNIVIEPGLVAATREVSKMGKNSTEKPSHKGTPKYQKTASKSRLKAWPPKSPGSSLKKSKRALKNPPLAKKMAITISKNNEIIYW